MREPQQGGVVADRYRIDAPLSRGVMGLVCATTHMVTDQRLALK